MEKMSYRDYLVWQVGHTIACLSDGLRMAMDMNDEEYAVDVLEGKMKTSRELLKFRNPNPERVLPRP